MMKKKVIHRRAIGKVLQYYYNLIAVNILVYVDNILI